jgi:phage gp29-like protein
MILRRRKEDFQREYPADGITPQGLIALFRAADAGDLSSQLALFEQMEEKDAHLHSVARTRRLAVTGLAWEILPAGGETPVRMSSRQQELAGAAAAYCAAALREAEGFEEALSHLALAVGRNLSLVELVWEATGSGPRLAGLAPVDFGRIVIGELGEVRLVTEAFDREGMALPRDKFIVHQPSAAGGHAARGGLLRATATAYIGKRFALKDWLIFAEVFGMPVRIARYGPGATPEEKRELLEMLKQLGADATGVFSKAVELEVIQSRSPGETNLYENLCLYLDREMSKAWLGQTLTTDTTRMLASAGAAKVHDQVRRDIRDDDLRQEARTLRRDLLRPLTRLAFGPAAPVPHFRRVAEQRFEPERLAGVLDVAVNRLGLRVPSRWVHSALGLPRAAEGEEALRQRMANAE